MWQLRADIMQSCSYDGVCYLVEHVTILKCKNSTPCIIFKDSFKKKRKRVK